MLMMELIGTWKNRRPQSKFMDVVKKDMQKIGAKEDVRDRMSWRQIIPLW